MNSPFTPGTGEKLDIPREFTGNDRIQHMQTSNVAQSVSCGLTSGKKLFIPV